MRSRDGRFDQLYIRFKVLCVPPATVIDGDTRASCGTFANLGCLEFCKRKSASKSCLVVVFEGWAVDGWPHNSGGCRCLSGCSPCLLLSGLVEPGLYACLPLLSEVVARDLIIVLHFDGLLGAPAVGFWLISGNFIHSNRQLFNRENKKRSLL